MNRALICQLRRLLRSHMGNVRCSYWICVFTSPLCSATCTRACLVPKCLLFLQRTSWASPWPPEVHEGRGISDGTVSQLHMKRIGFKRFQDFSEYRPSRGKISSLNPWLFRVYSVHCLKHHAAVNGWGTLHTCSWLRSASIFSAFTQWPYALPEVLEVPFSGRFCFESGLWSSLYKISFRCNIHSSMILLMKRRYIWQDDTSPRAFSFESSSLQHSIYSKPLPRSAPLARWGTMFHLGEKNAQRSRNNLPNLKFESSICLASFVWGSVFRFCQLSLLVYWQRLDDHWLIWPLSLPITMRFNTHYREHLWSCNCHRSPFARIPLRRIVSEPPACCVWHRWA